MTGDAKRGRGRPKADHAAQLLALCLLRPDGMARGQFLSMMAAADKVQFSTAAGPQAPWVGRGSLKKALQRAEQRYSEGGRFKHAVDWFVAAARPRGREFWFRQCTAHVFERGLPDEWPEGVRAETVSAYLRGVIPLPDSIVGLLLGRL